MAYVEINTHGRREHGGFHSLAARHCFELAHYNADRAAAEARSLDRALKKDLISRKTRETV